MNDDEFEDKLRALTSALGRPDPTPAWRADIVTRALRDAQRGGARQTLPPRWLLAGWAAAWAAALVLHFAAPRSSPLPGTARVDMTRQTKSPTATALVAYDHQLHLNLDLP